MSLPSFDHQQIRASAGSGKTHQLTNRYLGLLAAGATPESILATTFTRKAAGEILDRVLERLAAAAATPTAAASLATDLGRPDLGPAEFMALLRRAVYGMHRLRVGTLDGFSVALAGCCGAELGLPVGWAIGDDADEAALRSEALERLFEAAPDHIQTLLPLLAKGDTGRSVHAELLKVVEANYERYCDSEPAAWERLQVPEPLSDAERVTLLNQLQVFDFSACRNKRFNSARDKDIERFQAGDWESFIGTGLAKSVIKGDFTFCGKDIPAAAIQLYDGLLRHASSQMLGALAGQTRATWDLLDGFHRELRALKEQVALLRFDEITRALADGIGQTALPTDAAAYRLGGDVDHLLLDEFQDTSHGQWRVLRPIAQRVTGGPDGQSRSFFCVGDVKQAIYGWRGGMAEIFDTLESALGRLTSRSLAQSRRSAQPIIDVVNAVFGGLDRVDLPEKCEDGLAAWRTRFEQHTTVKLTEPGHVCLRTGPAPKDGQGVADQRADHCAYVAAQVRDLAAGMPSRTVGVLCRRTETVAAMIFELRKAGVDASEEAGSPVTDSPAVELLLSLFTLADHPEHSAAWFHLTNSPLKDRLAAFADADAVSQALRRDLQIQGYGPFANEWAGHIAGACDRRDLDRLQQLVELAFDFQPRNTLRADDFVAWVRRQKVPAPTGANVRVMTIHAAKGLQFDAVVLPELDVGLLGTPPTLVIGRDPRTLEVNFVCRYAAEAVQGLLAAEDRDAFRQDAQRRVEESLSLLYVAMTRAIYALHLYAPGPRTGPSDKKDGWYNILLQTLAPGSPWRENSVMDERGDPNWAKMAPVAKVQLAPEPEPLLPITFREPQSPRRRGLETVAPSHGDHNAPVVVRDLFERTENAATAVGRLFHAWFATVGWLDDSEPTDAELAAAAEPLRADLPADVWREYDRHLAAFRLCLRRPAVRGALVRSAYAGRGPTVALTLERERRFLVTDGDRLLSGSIDRLVWLRSADGTLAADILDFKTDAVAPTDPTALAARREFHRPQLESYRRAVARMGRLPEARVTARLVFTAGAVESV